MGSYNQLHINPVHDLMRKAFMQSKLEEPSLAEEVAKLTKVVEELVYWVRPMTGSLVTGKAAVEEYERLTQGGSRVKR